MSDTRLILDISRLLSRAGQDVPSGVDRVELEYARYLLAREPARAEFVAMHPLGLFGGLDFTGAAGFIAALAAQWGSGGGEQALHRSRRLRQQILIGAGPRPQPGQYMLLSHHHLTRPRVIARTLARRGAAFVPMVHDLIPSDYPEYARPGQAAKHLLRLRTVARLAHGVLVPSETVREGVLPWLRRAGRAHVPVQVVRHGVGPAAAGPALDAAGTPYFVCLGTIEPRKNHLLLLNIWRRLAQIHGSRTPRLVLIGRRGWENENVIDMIERCPALQGVVEERGNLPDDTVARLLAGARALLFPSFAEGFGLPLAEALALGVPVVCSDIPVFREIGGDAPEYLDPLDGLGWLAAIERRTWPDTPVPAPAGWEATGWAESVAAGLRFVESVVAYR